MYIFRLGIVSNPPCKSASFSALFQAFTSISSQYHLLLSAAPPAFVQISGVQQPEQEGGNGRGRLRVRRRQQPLKSEMWRMRLSTAASRAGWPTGWTYLSPQTLLGTPACPGPQCPWMYR